MTHQLVSQHGFDDSLTQYGDGVFETMLAIGDKVHHWNYHWQRLESSCRRLAIATPDYELLIQQLHAELISQNNTFSVVKMIVSRGQGLRGYRSHTEQPCYIQFSISPYHLNASLYQGLNIRVCQTRLSYQPLLAGMKHINRLEYILARREVEDTAFDEGLLLNYDNNVIEGLVSNVFLIKDKNIFTPSLSGSGVSGTLRAYLLDYLPTLDFRLVTIPLTMTDLADADEVFLTNATNGIMPVTKIQGIKKLLSTLVTNRIRQKMEHPCSKL